MSCFLCARPFSAPHHHMRDGVCVDGCARSGSSSAFGAVDELPVRAAAMPPSPRQGPLKVPLTVAAARTTTRVA